MLHGFRITFEYLCDNTACRMTNLFPLKEKITDLYDLGTMAEQHKPEQCYICSWPMHVQKAEIMRIPKAFHPFGNPRGGHWLCPKRCLSVDKVYPCPLQYAFDDMKERTHMWPSIYIHKYETIANGGYPWKCPVCSSELEYTEEKVNRHE